MSSFINREISKVLSEYDKKIAEHRLKVIRNEYPMENIFEWIQFKDEIIQLSNYYFSTHSRHPNAEKNENYKYLSLLVDLISKIEAKSPETMNEKDFQKIKEQIRTICTYKTYNFALEEIERQKIIAIHKHYKMDYVENIEGENILMPTYCIEEYKEIIQALKALKEKYQEANDYIFGGPTLENNSKAM